MWGEWEVMVKEEVWEGYIMLMLKIAEPVLGKHMYHTVCERDIHLLIPYNEQGAIAPLRHH